MAPLANLWMAQASAEQSAAFLGLWVCLSAGLAFWGYRRAQDQNAPGWVGALTVFVVSMSCSLIGGLLAVYLLVPVVARLYPKRTGGAPAPYFQPPAGNYAPSGPLQADAQGFVTCPSCGTRTKAGRKACMNCGNMLPTI